MMATSFYSQESSKAYREHTNITSQDVQDTIDIFKTDNLKKSVVHFQKRFGTPKSNHELRKKVLDKIKAKYRRVKKIDNPVLMQKFDLLLKKLFTLYARTDFYKIIVLDHPTPYIISYESGVIVITNGLLTKIKSDDEFLAFIAHEIAHDYFIDYSKYTEHLIKIVGQRDKETALTRQFATALALLELQCDVFASISLAYLGYDPSSFADALVRLREGIPIDPTALHPPNRIRRQVMIGVLPDSFHYPKNRRISPLFAEIQKLSKHRNALSLLPVK